MRVAIIHPWFPHYRLAFFEHLVRDARAEGIRIDIFHGDPPPEWKERGDAVRADFAIPLTTRFIPVGSRSLGLKSLKHFKRAGPYDLVILEQAVRNLETYLLVASHPPSRLAFWGHGRTYTAQTGSLQERLKRWLTSRGSWFFSYTDGGATVVSAGGFDASRITVVRNSIDTRNLRADLDGLSAHDVASFRARHGITGSCGLFLGGLDEAKRLPFLLDAARRIQVADPTFKLLVAGAGSLSGLVAEEARTSGHVIDAGPLVGLPKALALAAASVILMPGRVGLIAVDSLASGVPVATTRWPWHAPEFEYLTPDETALVTDDDVDAYAKGVIALLRDPPALSSMSRRCLAQHPQYSVEEMAGRFLTGISAALRTGAAR